MSLVEHETDSHVDAPNGAHTAPIATAPEFTYGQASLGIDIQQTFEPDDPGDIHLPLPLEDTSVGRIALVSPEVIQYGAIPLAQTSVVPPFSHPHASGPSIFDVDRSALDALKPSPPSGGSVQPFRISHTHAPGHPTPVAYGAWHTHPRPNAHDASGVSSREPPTIRSRTSPGVVRPLYGTYVRPHVAICGRRPGVTHDPDADAVVTAHAEYRSLNVLLAIANDRHAVSGVPRSTDDAVAGVLLQIALALRSLAAIDRSHGDIKPSNVIIANNGTVKLSDFAALAGRPPTADDVAHQSTNHYVARERYMHCAAFLPGPADVWSAMCIARTLIFGHVGFSRCASARTATDLVAALAAPDPLPPEAGGPLAALLAGMADVRPRWRPTADDLLFAPFITRQYHSLAAAAATGRAIARAALALRASAPGGVLRAPRACHVGFDLGIPSEAVSATVAAIAATAACGAARRAALLDEAAAAAAATSAAALAAGLDRDTSAVLAACAAAAAAGVPPDARGVPADASITNPPKCGRRSARVVLCDDSVAHVIDGLVMPSVIHGVRVRSRLPEHVPAARRAPSPVRGEGHHDHDRPDRQPGAAAADGTATTASACGSPPPAALGVAVYDVVPPSLPFPTAAHDAYVRAALLYSTGPLEPAFTVADAFARRHVAAWVASLDEWAAQRAASGDPSRPGGSVDACASLALPPLPHVGGIGDW